ncbi:MAG: hypothetical protein Q8Q42_04390 [Nanoarchaeota archaeon]|nr:hypothetical protein [Nanoarchaeota archaeon]
MEYSNNKYKNISRIVVPLILIIGLFLAAYYTGFTREYCGTDENCFLEKAKTCSPAEVYLSKSNNIYYHKITPELKNNCKLIIRFERAQEGTLPEHIELLEGKSMKCIIPKSELKKLNLLETNEVIDYCTGPLKEGLYELMVKRMYELIVVNLGEIAEEAKKLIKV